MTIIWGGGVGRIIHDIMVGSFHASFVAMISLVRRPSHVFQCMQGNLGRSGW